MGALDNLDASEMRALIKRVERLERAAPVGFSTVSRGALIIKSAEGLIVEGSASVTGILKGIGQFLWDGIVTLTSTFTANGPWNLNGVGTITGNSTQTGNMTVNSPGKIIVAGSNAMTLGVGTFGIPGVGFGSGGGISGYTGGVIVHAGNALSALTVNGTGPTMANGSMWVAVKSTGTEVQGVLNLNGLPSVSAVGKTPNLWIDSAGKVWKLI